MLSRKLALLLAVGVVQLEAKDAGTVIAQFRVMDQDLPSTSKWFINKTKHKIKFRWVVRDIQTGEFYAQEPFVEKNGSIEMGMPAAVNYFGSNVGSLGYDITIEVCKVLKTPRHKWDDTDVRPFKNGSKDLLISSVTFRENNDFELLLNKSGNLDCKPLLPSKELSRKQR